MKRPNPIVRIAREQGREYITPEDVATSRRKHGAMKTRLALLRVLGGFEGVGCEDKALCCFVAMRTRKKE